MLMRGTPLSVKVALGLIIIVALISGWFQLWQQKRLDAVTTYAECVKFPGAVIQESYPATCVLPDKRSFIDELTYEQDQSVLR